MARERMITRTVATWNYTVMVVDTASKSVEEITVSIPSAGSMTDKAISKAIRDNLPDGKLFVQTVSSTTTETLYGMTEEDFIRYAKVLPPRSGSADQA